MNLEESSARQGRGDACRRLGRVVWCLAATRETMGAGGGEKLRSVKLRAQDPIVEHDL
jgi:hypothetical protein